MATCPECKDGSYIPPGKMTEHFEAQHGDMKQYRRVVAERKKLNRYQLVGPATSTTKVHSNQTYKYC